MTAPLPNFVYFGAPKTGSGTITTYLAGHPEVFAPRPKELNFFNRDSRFEKGIEWYKEVYFGSHSGEPVICDNSIGYATGNPKETMERIVGALGTNFRILLTMRNPASRAYSNYCMARYKGRIETLGFVQAIQSGLEMEGHYSREELQASLDQQTYYSDHRSMAIFRHAVYIVPGRYAELLRICRAAVGSERVLVLFTEDMAIDLSAELRRLTDFLKIQPVEIPNDIRRNESTTLKYPWLRSFYNKIMTFGSVRQVYRNLGVENRKALRRKLLSWNYRRNESIPTAEPEAIEMLRLYYQKDVTELQDQLTRDLCRW